MKIDGLLERLRLVELPLTDDAADRIEALEAENARLLAALRKAIAGLDHAEERSQFPWLAVNRVHADLRAAEVSG